MTNNTSHKRRSRWTFWLAITGSAAVIAGLSVYFGGFDLVGYIQRLHGS